MRVLNVMLSRGLGGVQKAFAGYTTLLGHLGHEVVSCVAPGALVRSYLPAYSTITRLPNAFERDPVAILRAAYILRKRKPDLIVVHGKRALMLMSFARRLAGLNIPLVNVLHRHRLKHIARADLNICISEPLRNEAAAAGVDPAKLAYVPNFLTGELTASTNAVRRDPPVVGFLGRMVPEKGLDLLIEALRILKESGVRVTARIGGDGPERQALMGMASARALGPDLQWLGWVDSVSDFHNSIDVLCVPSRWESFGLVILEAYKAGVAVVSTRTTGPVSIIKDKINGLLCDIDAKDLAAKLKVVIENPEFAQRMANQAAYDVMAYDIAAVAPAVEALLQNVVMRVSAARAPDLSSAASGVANQ